MAAYVGGPNYPLVGAAQAGGSATTSSPSGLLYLWSPLVIALVALGCVILLSLILCLACTLHNLCTYGLCCPPRRTSCCSCDGCCPSGGECCWWCQPPRPVARPVGVRRRSSAGSVRSYASSGNGSVRVARRPRVTFNEPTYIGRATRYSGSVNRCGGRACDEEPVYTVNRQPRQQVMFDEPPVVQRPALGNIRIFANEGSSNSLYQQSFNTGGFVPDQQMGGFGINQQQMGGFGMMNQPQMGGFGVNQHSGGFMHQLGGLFHSQPLGGGGGGFMGSQQQPPMRRIMYNPNENPTVSCELRQDQPREYVLTPVEGSTGGGSFSRGGMSHETEDDIEISTGAGEGGNNFYPTLPQYDENDRKY